VPGQPFYFKLEFFSGDVSDALLGELASQVLHHVGCSRQDVPELDGALARAVATTAVRSCRCDVQFRLQNGALEIVVRSDGGPLFQTSHPVADRS
jgi:hypothetical protein